MKAGLTLPSFVCHVVTWVREKNVLLSLSLCFCGIERDGPGTMRVGELALAPTSYSTWEGRHGSLPRQHTRGDPVGWGAGELGWSVREQKGCSCPLWKMPRDDKGSGNMPSSIPCHLRQVGEPTLGV